jgi:predicted glycoside hydrolase/deacetylase ChbG (UPF0249 family)
MDHLLVRTDDAGSCEGANEGIRDAINAGLARNVSIMAVGPAFESAARLLRNRTEICFGLHLVLTSEWESTRWGALSPADSVPALLDADRTFPRSGQTVHDRQVPADQVLAELTAQYERAINAGFRIAYVDEHMGIGWAAGVRNVIVQFCAERDLIVADALPLKPLGFPANVNALADWTKSAVAEESTVGICVTHPSTRTKDANQQYGFGQAPGVVAAERDANRLMLIAPEFAAAIRDADLRISTYAEAAPLLR